MFLESTVQCYTNLPQDVSAGHIFFTFNTRAHPAFLCFHFPLTSVSFPMLLETCDVPIPSLEQGMSDLKPE